MVILTAVKIRMSTPYMLLEKQIRGEPKVCELRRALLDLKFR